MMFSSIRVDEFLARYFYAENPLIQPIFWVRFVSGKIGSKASYLRPLSADWMRIYKIPSRWGLRLLLKLGGYALELQL
jgi:hypothetical protein